jgi:hypothetical protein
MAHYEQDPKKVARKLFFITICSTVAFAGAAFIILFM